MDPSYHILTFFEFCCSRIYNLNCTSIGLICVLNSVVSLVDAYFSNFVFVVLSGYCMAALSYFHKFFQQGFQIQFGFSPILFILVSLLQGKGTLCQALGIYILNCIQILHTQPAHRSHLVMTGFAKLTIEKNQL